MNTFIINFVFKTFRAILVLSFAYGAYRTLTDVTFLNFENLERLLIIAAAVAIVGVCLVRDGVFWKYLLLTASVAGTLAYQSIALDPDGRISMWPGLTFVLFILIVLAEELAEAFVDLYIATRTRLLPKRNAKLASLDESPYDHQREGVFDPEPAS